MAHAPGSPSPTSTGSAALGGDLVSDLFALVGMPNPLTGIITTMEQMRRGTDDFLAAVETFTRAMENVNETASRVNRLLDDVEGPIRAVAPAMSRLADTLNSPTLAALPSDLNDVVRALGDLARRLAPLGQLAESAGGMFGLRALIAGAGRVAPPLADDEVVRPAPAAAKKAPAKKAPAKKAAAKRTAAKKTAAKKTATKKAAAKKKSGSAR